MAIQKLYTDSPSSKVSTNRHRSEPSSDKFHAERVSRALNGLNFDKMNLDTPKASLTTPQRASYGTIASADGNVVWRRKSSSIALHPPESAKIKNRKYKSARNRDQVESSSLNGLRY